MNTTDVVFEAKKYKDSLTENRILHSLLYGISKTLGEIKPTMGYSTLSRIGSYMIQYLKEYGFKPTSSEDPYERIIHLCKFYTDEGMVRKINLKMMNNAVQVKAYGVFGSPVFADLYIKRGLEHIRPCPLLAMVLAQLSEIGYIPEIRKLDYDKDNDIWHIDLEILKMDGGSAI